MSISTLRRLGLVTLAVGIGSFGAIAGVSAQATSAAPSSDKGRRLYADEDLVTIPVTVRDIDRKNRKLVVRDPEGERLTVNVPSDAAREFNRLDIGDKIDVDVYQAAAVSASARRGGPVRTASESTTQGPHGKMGTREVSASAEVVSVDRTEHDPGEERRRQAADGRGP